MENWKLLLAGIRNALSDLIEKTFNVKGEVSVSNLPEVQHVVIDNPQEPTETVKVSNLIDYKEELNKIIGELIKVPKDIKTADYSPIIKALQDVVKTLEADKTDYSPIILAIESAVKQLKVEYPKVDYTEIIKAIDSIKKFNLDDYLEQGELPVIINDAQIKKLVDAFGKKTAQVITTMGGGGSSSNVTATIDTSSLAKETGGNLEKIANATKLEDDGHVSGDRGVFILGVRNEGHDDFSGTDKDYIPIGCDATGDVYTNVRHLPTTPSGTNIIGKVGIDQTTNGTTNKVYVGNSTTNPIPVQPPVVGYHTVHNKYVLPLATNVSSTLTLTNASTAYQITEPDSDFLVTYCNMSDTDMYWGFATLTSGGVLLPKNGGTLTLKCAANNSPFFYCASAGKVLNYSTSVI